MKPIIEIRGSLIYPDADPTFTIAIEAPEKGSTSRNYFCRITSSPAFNFRIDAYGVIPQQAVRLALEMTAARIANALNANITDQWVEDEENEEGKEKVSGTD